MNTAWHLALGGPGEDSEKFEDWSLDIRIERIIWVSLALPSTPPALPPWILLIRALLGQCPAQDGALEGAGELAPSGLSCRPTPPGHW